MQKADVAKRIIAMLIDCVLVFVLSLISFGFGFIPFLGRIIGLVVTLCGIAYMASRDALPIKDLDGASIGKKLVGLKAVNRNGQNITWEQSAKRNLPFFLPSLIALVFSFIPVLNVVIAFGVGLLGLLIVIVELLKVVSDKDGLRIGDLFAETRVIEVPK